MSAQNLVMLGVPAYVAEVIGRTNCRFTYKKNDFTQLNYITIDLAADSSLDPSKWDNTVDVDTFATGGGLTTIGPVFHEESHKGAVYISQRIVASVRSRGVLQDWPPAPDIDAQYTCVLRFENSAKVRYYGFKAKILDKRSSLYLVGFIGPSQDEPSRSLWLELDNSKIADPKSNGFTTLDANTPIGVAGALFLPSDSAQNLALTIPKLPPGFGSQQIP
jgi:hypothetical protein